MYGSTHEINPSGVFVGMRAPGCQILQYHGRVVSFLPSGLLGPLLLGGEAILVPASSSQLLISLFIA